MGNKKMELVFLLDRSGSMCGLEEETIGGFNSVLEKQQKLEGEAFVTTVLFDDRFELLHDRVELARVQPMTFEEYYVRGGTALMDALGQTMTRITQRQQHAAPCSKSDQVLFVIITDGCENASREYSAAQVRAMIKSSQSEQGWEFLFLGANIDAAETAAAYGIDRKRAVNYVADEAGTKTTYSAVACAAASLRKESVIDESWRECVDEDFERRG